MVPFISVGYSRKTRDPALTYTAKNAQVSHLGILDVRLTSCDHDVRSDRDGADVSAVRDCRRNLLAEQKAKHFIEIDRALVCIKSSYLHFNERKFKHHVRLFSTRQNFAGGGDFLPCVSVAMHK